MYGNTHSLPQCSAWEWTDQIEEYDEGSLVIDERNDATKPQVIKTAEGPGSVYSTRPEYQGRHHSAENNLLPAYASGRNAPKKEPYHYVFPHTKRDKQTIHVRVKMFNSQPFVDIRKYFIADKGKSMEWLPTRKGICLSVKDFRTMTACIQNVNESLASASHSQAFDDN